MTNKVNAVYAQSGGVTAVINCSASGVIKSWRENASGGNLYAAQNGILGVLNEDLIDTSVISDEELALMNKTPGGIFGSCRYKLRSIKESYKHYQRIIEVFKAHDIGYFFYNGGNDSADTCLKIATMANEMGYPLKALHIPKTIDNDLAITDNSPGFGSAAKYVATSIREAGFDLASMYRTSTKVFILEVMGRNAGWIAAACGLAADGADGAPHIILFPEIPFDEQAFLAKVKSVSDKVGYCVIAAAEGIKNMQGVPLSVLSDARDDFGHVQLGGVAAILAKMINDKLQLKQHWAVADYLQRSARHLASKTDAEQAYALGYAAVNFALAGKTAVMLYIKRIAQHPYAWEIDCAPLESIANQEKLMPRDFINAEGFHITHKCRDYIAPLLNGEDLPVFKDGLPKYLVLNPMKISKRLADFNE